MFVSGATETVGSAVVRFLLKRGERVVAGVRDENVATRLPAEVQVWEFDFASDKSALRAALEGCDRLFLMRPPPIDAVEEFLLPVIDVAMELDFRQVVFLSLQGVQYNWGVPHYRVEQYLEKIDAPFTFLRPNFFMQSLSTTATPGHDGRKYTLSGTRALTFRNVARILSDVLDRSIRYARPTETRYPVPRERGRARGLHRRAKMIYRVVQLSVSAVLNRMVRKLTGRPATSFRAFAERERQVWAPGSLNRADRRYTTPVWAR